MKKYFIWLSPITAFSKFLNDSLFCEAEINALIIKVGISHPGLFYFERNENSYKYTFIELPEKVVPNRVDPII